MDTMTAYAQGLTDDELLALSTRNLVTAQAKAVSAEIERRGLTSTHTKVTHISDALSAHQGSWDSWGWHCSCGAGRRLSHLPIAEGVNPGKGGESRAALLNHQAQAVAAAVA